MAVIKNRKNANHNKASRNAVTTVPNGESTKRELEGPATTLQNTKDIQLTTKYNLSTFLAYIAQRNKILKSDHSSNGVFSYDKTATVIFIAAVLMRLTTIFGEFIWDDRMAIVANKDLRWETPILNLFSNDFWGQDITGALSHKSYRPIATLTFRLNYGLHGLHGVGYHIGNVLVHALTCVLVLSFARRLFKNELQSIVCAVLFLSHPLHTEAVASTVGRSDVLCGFFFMYAICSYRTKDENINVLSFISAVLSTFSKEIGITTFGMLVGHEIVAPLISSTSGTTNRHRNMNQTDILGTMKKILHHFLKPIVMVRVLISVSLVLLSFWLHIRLHGATMMRQWTEQENEINFMHDQNARITAYAHLHFVAFRKLFFPFWLSYDYSLKCIDHVLKISDLRNLYAVSMYFTFIASAIYGLLYENVIILWTIALFLVPYIPAANIFFPVGTILADRLLYLPTVGFCFAMTLILFEMGNFDGRYNNNNYNNNYNYNDYSNNYSNNNSNNDDNDSSTQNDKKKQRKIDLERFHKRNKIKQLCSLLSLFLCVVAFSIKSQIHNLAWNNEFSLFLSARKTCPNGCRNLSNIGFHMMKPELIDEGIPVLTKAIELCENFAPSYVNRGLMYSMKEQKLQAILDYEKAIKYEPKFEKAKAYLGQEELLLSEELRNRGDAQSADALLDISAQHLDAAIAGGVKLPMAYHVRGSVALEKKNFKLALLYLTRAMEINDELIAMGAPLSDTIFPENTYNQMGLAYWYIGEEENAFTAWYKALDAKPTMAEVYGNMALSYYKSNEYDKATEVLEKALSLNPTSGELLNNIGWNYELGGNYDEALRHYRQAYAYNQHQQILTNIENVEIKLAQEKQKQREKELEEKKQQLNRKPFYKKDGPSIIRRN